VLAWTTPVVALLAVTWVALLFTAPLLSAPLGGVLYAAGSLICHQIAERSFHLQGYQLPVCGRCFGLYVGGALGSVAVVVRSVAAGRNGTPYVVIRGGKRAALVATIVAALPTLLTFVLESGAGWPLSNVTRAIAAVPLGLTVAFVVAGALPTLHYDECAHRRPFDHGQPPQTNI
jgi:hypothetical protein